MKKMLALFCVLILAVSTTGCNYMVKNKFVGGKWQPLGEWYVSLEFHKDGTVTVNDGEYDYSGDVEWYVDGDSLFMDGKEYEYEFVTDTLLELRYEGYRLTFMLVLRPQY